ncbi:MAG: hypothetical protein WBD09_03905 [Halobacteriota archaeon]
MKSQIEEIKDYLRDKDFEPDIIIDKTGTKARKTLEDNHVDIVLTDKNIVEEKKGVEIKTGMDVIKLIKDIGKWTDVLFYSARGFDRDEVREEIGNYGFVEIVEGKEIVDDLKKLIDKNLNRCQDIVYLRGMLLSKIIDLEQEVNDFFVKYFNIPDEKEAHFHNLVLENRFSLESKNTALSKIIKGDTEISSKFKKILSKLSDIAEQRNFLAHCKVHPEMKNTLISIGSEKVFDKKRINEIIEKIESVSEDLDKLSERICFSHTKI